jgi:peptidylprolyl isomerase
MAFDEGDEEPAEADQDIFTQDAQNWTQHKVHVVAAARRGEDKVHAQVPRKGGPINQVDADLSHPSEPDAPREAWPINFMPDGLDVLGNGCVLKRVKKEGIAALGTPALGCNVKAHYTAQRMDGRQWDTSRGKYAHFHFIIGMNYVNKLLEAALPTMRHGEVAEYVCTPSYAALNEGTQAKMPRLEKSFRYEVELLGWREPRAESKFELGAAEVLAEAEMYKRHAAAYVGACCWAEAEERYADVRSLLEEDWGDRQEVEDEPALRQRGQALLAACRLNSAMCALKLGELRAAERHASRVLAHDACCVKALYRRGLARTGLHEFGAAKADLRRASELDPKSREVREAFGAARRAEAAAEVRDAATFGKVFINEQGSSTQLYPAPGAPQPA